MKDNKYSWNNISINKYYEISDIINDSALSDIDKNVAIVAIIEDVPEDTIWALPIDEAKAKFNKLAFLGKFDLIKIREGLFGNSNPKLTIVNHHFTDVNEEFTDVNKVFTLVNDATKLTVAQFTDYQSFVTKPLRESIDKVLSIFVIPEGCTYNTGYDVVEIQKFFRENMSFLLAQSILNFILTKYVKSMNASLKCLAKAIMKTKNEEKKATMINQYNQIIAMYNQILRLIGSVSLNV